MANLYYLTGDDINGDSVDQLVRATSPQHALDLWHEYKEDQAFSKEVSTRPCSEAGEDDLQIFYIPNVPAIGVIEWHTLFGANVVAFAESTAAA